MYPISDVALNPEAPADLTTLAAVKAIMGIADTASDAALTALLPVASQQIEDYCGVILAERTVTETVIPDDPLDVLTLKYNPASALTSVTVAGMAQTVGDLRLLKRAGILQRADGAPIAAPGTEVVAVYTAGYASGSMPATIGQAAALLVQSLHVNRNRDSSVKRESAPDVGDVEYDLSTGANGNTLPADIALLLAPFVRYY